jgi:hypothetical protein
VFSGRYSVIYNRRGTAVKGRAGGAGRFRGGEEGAKDRQEDNWQD